MAKKDFRSTDAVKPKRQLLPHHRQQLQESGLTEATIEVSGIYSESATGKVASVLNRKSVPARQGPWLMIPFYDRCGDKVLTRVKPDNPMYRKGKPQKYLQPTKARTRVYIPPASEIIDDPKQAIAITEGEKKSLCLTQNGLLTLGLVGVDCWHPKGSVSLNTDLESIEWNNRNAFIVFDSDAITNDHVKRNESQLGQALQRHGAFVRVIRIPPGDDGEKQGVDDFIVAHGMDEFWKLANEASEPEPLPPGESLSPPGDMDPAREARAFIEHRKQDGCSTDVFWRDSFYRWKNGKYWEIADAEMDSNLVRWLNTRYHGVKSSLKSNLSMQVQAQAFLPNRTESPTWRLADDLSGLWSPNEILATNDSIIHLPSLVDGKEYQQKATPAFFNTVALDFRFDPDAPRPGRWLDFLNEVFGGDQEAIQALQSWFGYILTPDTRQQKILGIFGPKRSGKGTIGRIMQQVAGIDNCVSPTFSGLAGEFGMQPLIDKTLAIVADARLSGRSDATVLTERLLSISGEDLQTINRKHKPMLTAKLSTRFVIISNELPSVVDASGALASRMIILPIKQTFYGRENHELIKELLTELPGILLWAIRGWSDLRQRGTLLQPDSGRELVEEMNNLGSPVGAFVRQCCAEVGEVPTSAIFNAYSKWCRDQGKSHIFDESKFGRDLRAVLPNVGKVQRTINGVRTRVYVGVCLA